MLSLHRYARSTPLPSGPARSLWQSGIVLTLSCLIPTATTLSDEPQPVQPSATLEQQLQSKIDRLASGLYQDEFAVRQRAMRELFDLGYPAIDPAITAAISSDSEARRRGEMLLTQFTLTNLPGARVAIRERLASIANQDADLAPAANRLRKQLQSLSVRAAKQDIERSGGTVRDQRDVDEATTGPFSVSIGKTWKGGDEAFKAVPELENVAFLSIDQAPLTDKIFVEIAKLQTLDVLSVTQTRVTEAGLAKLPAHLNLRMLAIAGIPLSDEGLEKMPPYEKLQLIDLSNTKLTDKGLAHLAKYPSLEKLWLQQTDITAAGMVHIANLNNLEELALNRTKVSGPQLGSLKVLPSLSKIEFKGNHLEPDTLKYLAGFPALSDLNLDNTNVTDAQLADLAQIAPLRELHLARTKLTDAAVQHLKQLKQLENLYLHGTGISPTGEQELRKALPQCQIRS